MYFILGSKVSFNELFYKNIENKGQQLLRDRSIAFFILWNKLILHVMVNWDVHY